MFTDEPKDRLRGAAKSQQQIERGLRESSGRCRFLAVLHFAVQKRSWRRRHHLEGLATAALSADRREPPVST
jgi:hypothetical protein